MVPTAFWVQRTAPAALLLALMFPMTFLLSIVPFIPVVPFIPIVPSAQVVLFVPVILIPGLLPLPRPLIVSVTMPVELIEREFVVAFLPIVWMKLIVGMT